MRAYASEFNVSSGKIEAVCQRREHRVPDQEHAPVFKEKKIAINLSALTAVKTIDELCSEEVIRHYSINEINPHCRRTPVVFLGTGSIPGEGFCGMVGQIGLFKPGHRDFDPRSDITEVRIGIASYEAPAGAKGRSMEASCELTMNGDQVYVDWVECPATDSIDVTQAEDDTRAGYNQGLNGDARRLLDGLPPTIEAILEAARDRQLNITRS